VHDTAASMMTATPAAVKSFDIFILILCFVYNECKSTLIQLNNKINI